MQNSKKRRKPVCEKRDLCATPNKLGEVYLQAMSHKCFVTWSIIVAPPTRSTSNTPRILDDVSEQTDQQVSQVYKSNHYPLQQPHFPHLSAAGRSVSELMNSWGTTSAHTKVKQFPFVLTHRYQKPKNNWFFNRDPCIAPWGIDKNVEKVSWCLRKWEVYWICPFIWWR